MKNKFLKKIICIMMACVFMVQTAPIYSGAVSLDESKVSVGSFVSERESVFGEILNTMLRYYLFGVIYEVTGMWGQLRYYDLKSITIKEISDDLSNCTMQFLCKEDRGYANMTVVIMIGSAAYWKDYTSSWTYYLFAGHELASVGLGIAASVGGIDLDITSQRISNCWANLWALRDLKAQAKSMGSKDTLAYVPVVISSINYLGYTYEEVGIQAGIVVGEDMVFPSVERDFTEKTLPRWITNGPTINFK